MNHGWEKKKLGDCITLIRNGANIRQAKVPNGYPITRIETLSNGRFNFDRMGYADIYDTQKYTKHLLQEGDILLSHINSKNYVGRMVIVPELSGKRIIHGMNLLRLQTEDFIAPKFLYYNSLSHSYKSQIRSRRKDAVNQSSVSISDLKSLLISVPSKEQQQAIVAELDAINEAIEVKRKQQKALNALVQALFYDTFGDPRTNPKSFPIHGLSDLCKTVSTGITYKPEMVAGDGTIVLRSSNIQDSKFVLDDIVRVQMPLKASQYVQKNDILMCSRNGSARLVGKVCLIPEQSESISWGAFMTIIRSDYYNFLFHYFKLPAFREQLRKTKTSTVNQITIGMLKRIRIPLPPLPLQQHFAAQVEEIERGKENVEATIARLQTLLDSRMDYWFND